MASAVAPRPVRVPIAESQGLMCAEEVVNDNPLPGFDQAAIDGYAVRSVDVQGGPDGEIVLPVTGVIEAGARMPSRLQPNQAALVHTGAPMPTLADAVLPLRWTDGGQNRVRVPTCAGPVMTSSPATSRYAPAPSSDRPRSDCWPRWAGNGCWSIRGPG